MRLKIGEFAKLGMVSVSALRYYADSGLLRPAETDGWTGYRYYTFEQLPLLHRILALKDLGLSLEQIRVLINENVAAEQIRLMLRVKQAELQAQAKDIGERLVRIETRLLQIEMDGKMPDHDVVVKRVEPIRTAALHSTIPRMEMMNATFDRLFDELLGYMKGQGIALTGPPLDLWYDDPHARPEDIPVAVFVPTDDDLPTTRRIKIEELPAVEQMAAVVHHGSFVTLTQAYGALYAWIQDNGYHLAGPSREIYHQYERGGDQSQYITELQIPVALNR